MWPHRWPSRFGAGRNQLFLHHGNTYGVMGALTKINVQRKIPTPKFKMGHCDFQNQPSAWKQASTPAFRSVAPPLWRLPVRTKTIRLE
jgi:hypothetical protein